MARTCGDRAASGGRGAPEAAAVAAAARCLGKRKGAFTPCALCCGYFFRTAAATSASSLNHRDPVRGVYCSRFHGLGKLKI